MKKTTLTTALTLAAAGVLLLQTPRVSAQDDAPPPPPPPAAAGAQGAGGPGGPGGPGGGGRGQFRQQMAERVKTALKASDDEWSVIEPLLTAVEEKQRATMTGRYGGMMGGPGGPGGPGGRGQRRNGGGQPDAAAGQPNGGPNGGGPGRGGSPEAQALTEALQNDSTSPADIKTKLAAVREQRKKAAAELTQARETLKKVLNMRQEATLVAMGILD